MRTMKLFDLLEESPILIPSLQRNYVHGRDDVHAKAVREHFVESLKKCCTTGEEMNLDVVYGVMKDSILVPLDGQQRLTTLWLSALYAVIQSLDGVEKQDRLFKLSRFSYEARPLASAFCRWLTSGAKVSDFKAALTQAENQWGDDPTVRSIVTTLRLIDEHFSEKGKAKKLLEAVSNQIHFKFAKVRGDSSDLYVKINARGKLLTQWENFKGEFAKQLSGLIKGVFECRVEKLSDQFFQVCGVIPDNAFFALFARLSDYELRKATNPSYDEKSHSNLTVLAESKVDSKNKQELPYVPVREFDLPNLTRKIVVPFLRIIQWTLDNPKKSFKYWNKSTIDETVFFPTSTDERDFSLFLYEYFRKYKSGAGLIENDCRALRLVANIFENVARNTRDGKDNTHSKHFNRIEVLKSYLFAAPGLYISTVDGGNNSLPPNVDEKQETPLQCVEENAKAKIYSSRGAATGMISVLQECEKFLHGRVRIAILDLSKDEPTDYNIDVPSNSELLLKRMKTIKNQFDTWKRKSVNERAEFFFTSIIPVFDWDIPNDVQFDFSDNGLKEVICTENDRCLQRTFVDGGESKDVEKGDWKIPAGRNWRTSLKTLKTIILQDTINANTQKDPKPWKVKWHWASKRYYLYTGGSQVTWSFPISDYRIDIFTDNEFKNEFESLVDLPPGKVIDLMRINENSSVHKRMKNRLDCYFYATSITVKAFKDSGVSKEASWKYEEFGDDISGFLQRLGKLSFDEFCDKGKGAIPPSRNSNPTEPSTNV